MNRPIFTINTVESVKMPGENGGIYRILKGIIWGTIVLMILCSVILGTNLFSEISLLPKVFLIGLVISSFSWDKKNKAPSPIEIQFYNEYLIIFRNKRYYDKRVSRKEYNKFRYSDIDRIEFEPEFKRFALTGIIDAKWFNYRKDGTLPDEPTYHRTVEDGICFFYLFSDDEEQIIEKLEQFSNMKVTTIS